jgi:hypothetical protein
MEDGNSAPGRIGTEACSAGTPAAIAAVASSAGAALARSQRSAGG